MTNPITNAAKDPAVQDQQANKVDPANVKTTNTEVLPFTNANHSGHDLYRQVNSGLDRLPPEIFANIDEKQKVAAVMTFEVAKMGFKNVDHIILSSDSRTIFAVGGALSNPASLRLHFDLNGLVGGESVEKTNKRWYDEFVFGKANKRKTIEEERIERLQAEELQQINPLGF